ncbi:hypothetical protein RUM43_001123 [Polyplax serrata]|uniref:Uncharacterized protein n=1 Tax=Polyplax serrata TaxID=468196 RepID=A0AAN8SDG7_POLSC
MTDTDRSVQNESDEDIYAGFADFNSEQELVKIENSREQYKEENKNLSEKIKDLLDENKKLKNLNSTLEKNLSTLLKTAQSEIKRKDSVIQELRVKDKYTNTENSEVVIDSINKFKACKCLKETKDSQSEKHGSREKYRKSEHRSSRNDKNKFDGRSSRHESRDRKQYSGSSHREKETKGQNSYYRNHSDYSYQGERRHSRESRSSHYSPPGSKSSKRDSRDNSPDTRRRSRRRNDSNSPHKEHSKSIKEHCTENHKNVKPVSKKDANNRNHEVKGSTSDKRKYESEKSEKRASEKPNGKMESAKISDSMTDASKKGKTEMFKRFSVLDALYDDMVTSKSSREIQKTKLDPVSTEKDLEEGECCEEDFSNSEALQEGEDWKLSFKNERQNEVKPLTVYSKRMMKKLLEKPIEKKQVPVNQTSKKVKQSPEAEKEPGELTDDESIVEKSKEFQEVTQAAIVEEKEIEKLSLLRKCEIPKVKNSSDTIKRREPVKGKNEDEVPGVIDVVNSKIVMVQPKLVEMYTPAEHQEQTLLDKKLESFKEVIEFSPFKNNYKLIEISPIKRTEKMKNEIQLSNSNTQKEVEKSIFSVLSSLSGIPVGLTGKETTDAIVKDTDLTNSEHDKTLNITPDIVHFETTCLQEGMKNKDCDKISHEEGVGQCQNRDIKRKTISLQSYKEKKKIENEISQNDVVANKEEEISDVASEIQESTPGETTQFLNFFLLTTSPSKPILPAEEEESLESQIRSIGGCTSDINKSESFNVSQGGALSQGNESIESSNHSTILTSSNTKITSINEIYSSDEISPLEPNKACGKKEIRNLERKKAFRNSEHKSSDDSLRDAPLLEGNFEKSRLPIRNEAAENVKQDKKNGKKRKISNGNTTDTPDGKKIKMMKSKKDIDHSPSRGQINQKKQEIPAGTKCGHDDSFKQPAINGETEGSAMDDRSNNADFTMTTTMSLRGVVRLQTPNKCVEKLKNLMINEQTIYQVLDTKTLSPFPPLIGAKIVEMTPRRMLKNDLMLTDSEDDVTIRLPCRGGSVKDLDENTEFSHSENSECESDSGASDFVDLL